MEKEIVKSVKELATEYGYKFKGTCHCDGYETYKFEKELYQLRWRKYAQSFQLLKGRTVNVNWAKITGLSDALKKLHADEVISKP